MTIPLNAATWIPVPVSFAADVSRVFALKLTAVRHTPFLFAPRHALLYSD